MIEAEHVSIHEAELDSHFVPQTLVQEDGVDEDEDPNAAGQHYKDIGHVLGQFTLNQKPKRPGQP